MIGKKEQTSRATELEKYLNEALELFEQEDHAAAFKPLQQIVSQYEQEGNTFNLDELCTVLSAANGVAVCAEKVKKPKQDILQAYVFTYNIYEKIGIKSRGSGLAKKHLTTLVNIVNALLNFAVEYDDVAKNSVIDFEKVCQRGINYISKLKEISTDKDYVSELNHVQMLNTFSRMACEQGHDQDAYDRYIAVCRTIIAIKNKQPSATDVVLFIKSYLSAILFCVVRFEKGENCDSYLNMAQKINKDMRFCFQIIKPAAEKDPLLYCHVKQAIESKRLNGQLYKCLAEKKREVKHYRIALGYYRVAVENIRWIMVRQATLGDLVLYRDISKEYSALAKIVAMKTNIRNPKNNNLFLCVSGASGLANLLDTHIKFIKDRHRKNFAKQSKLNRGTKPNELTISEKLNPLLIQAKAMLHLDGKTNADFQCNIQNLVKKISEMITKNKIVDLPYEGLVKIIDVYRHVVNIGQDIGVNEYLCLLKVCRALVGRQEFKSNTLEQIKLDLNAFRKQLSVEDKASFICSVYNKMSDVVSCSDSLVLDDVNKNLFNAINSDDPVAYDLLVKAVGKRSNSAFINSIKQQKFPIKEVLKLTSGIKNNETRNTVFNESKLIYHWFIIDVIWSAFNNDDSVDDHIDGASNQMVHIRKTIQDFQPRKLYLHISATLSSRQAKNIKTIMNSNKNVNPSELSTFCQNTFVFFKQHLVNLGFNYSAIPITAIRNQFEILVVFLECASEEARFHYKMSINNDLSLWLDEYKTELNEIQQRVMGDDAPKNSLLVIRVLRHQLSVIASLLKEHFELISDETAKKAIDCSSLSLELMKTINKKVKVNDLLILIKDVKQNHRLRWEKIQLLSQDYEQALDKLKQGDAINGVFSPGALSYILKALLCLNKKNKIDGISICDKELKITFHFLNSNDYKLYGKITNAVSNTNGIIALRGDMRNMQLFLSKNINGKFDWAQSFHNEFIEKSSKVEEEKKPAAKNKNTAKKNKKSHSNSVGRKCNQTQSNATIDSTSMANRGVQCKNDGSCNSKPTDKKADQPKENGVGDSKPVKTKTSQKKDNGINRLISVNKKNGDTNKNDKPPQRFVKIKPGTKMVMARLTSRSVRSTHPVQEIKFKETTMAPAIDPPANSDSKNKNPIAPELKSPAKPTIRPNRMWFDPNKRVWGDGCWLQYESRQELKIKLEERKAKNSTNNKQHVSPRVQSTHHFFQNTPTKAEVKYKSNVERYSPIYQSDGLIELIRYMLCDSTNSLSDEQIKTLMKTQANCSILLLAKRLALTCQDAFFIIIDCIRCIVIKQLNTVNVAPILFKGITKQTIEPEFKGYSSYIKLLSEYNEKPDIKHPELLFEQLIKIDQHAGPIVFADIYRYRTMVECKHAIIANDFVHAKSVLDSDFFEKNDLTTSDGIKLDK